MSITGPTFVFTILLEQQLKLCMCSSAEWTSNNLWTSVALNVQHVPVQRRSKLVDAWTPPTNYPISEEKKFLYDDNSNGEGHR